MDDLVVRAAFVDRFGHDPDIVTVAPGRVNLIGEHTDYNDGFVFPAAIDRRLYVAASLTDGPSILVSRQLGKGAPFDAATVVPGYARDWGQYAAGMAWSLRDRARVPNVQAAVHSEVPIGSGISSSAALELAFGVLYNHLTGAGIGLKDLALLGQYDENQFVGVQCGIMDQMASAMGREGCAMFLDTRSLDILYAQMSDELVIALCDTETPRALTDSAYNERRSQCEESARILGVPTLRDATTERLEQERPNMPEVVYRRARHVITENARCQLMLEALNTGQFERVGQLMEASHESLRDDYEVSSRELDLMAEAAWDAPGCVGARMTGAGFGGACVALVRRANLAEFTESVNSRYASTSNLIGEVLACRAVDGARVLWHSET